MPFHSAFFSVKYIYIFYKKKSDTINTVSKNYGNQELEMNIGLNMIFITYSQGSHKNL